MVILRREKIHPKLAEYAVLVKSLGTILGRDCEVLLHDVSSPECSIIACENAHVSGRSVGSAMTDLGLLMLKNPEYKEKNGVYNYLARTENGKELKCGVHFIKDEAGEIIGYLCINMDYSKARAAKELIEELFKIEGGNSKEPKYLEHFTRELDDVVSNSIAAVKTKWSADLGTLPKGDILDIVKELDKAGFFLVKGSIERLASETRRSKFTLYAYLREIHRDSQCSNGSALV